MRIVDHKEFLSLTGQTLYANYEPQVFGDLRIRGDTCWPHSTDFHTIPLFEIESRGSDEHCDLLWKADEDSTFNVPLEDEEGWSRDTLSYENQMFAVFDDEDIDKLIRRLKRCKRERIEK